MDLVNRSTRKGTESYDIKPTIVTDNSHCAYFSVVLPLTTEQIIFYITVFLFV